MNEWVLVSHWLVVGILATIFMDLFALGQKKLLGIASLNYCLVGRWLLYMPGGQFRHHTILQTQPRSGECALGWVSHYVIGVLFAALFYLLAGMQPGQASFAAVVLFGVATVVVPFFVMQPGLGFGVMAAKTPAPATARMRSVVAHASYGLGLFLALRLVSVVTL